MRPDHRPRGEELRLRHQAARPTRAATRCRRSTRWPGASTTSATATWLPTRSSTRSVASVASIAIVERRPMIPSSSPCPTSSIATTSRSTSSACSIDGCELDVRGAGFETFDDLVGYCRLVAGSVGRLSLAIFGTRYPESAEPRAEALGVALQVTNILRDVVEDREMGRVYLPARGGGRARLRARPVGSDARRSPRSSPPRSRAPRSTSTAASSCCRCSTAAAGRASRRWPGSTAGCWPGSPPTRRGCCGERVSLPAREKVWVAARSMSVGRA